MIWFLHAESGDPAVAAGTGASAAGVGRDHSLLLQALQMLLGLHLPYSSFKY